MYPRGDFKKRTLQCRVKIGFSTAREPANKQFRDIFFKLCSASDAGMVVSPLLSLLRRWPHTFCHKWELSTHYVKHFYYFSTHTTKVNHMNFWFCFQGQGWSGLKTYTRSYNTTTNSMSHYEPTKDHHGKKGNYSYSCFGDKMCL